MSKVSIIGSGVGGLACAIRMAVRGYEVHVFEKNDYPGGKLSEVRHDSYRFDAGPSLFTMPQYIEALFELAGEAASDHFRYEKLPIVCQYFWDDGTKLKAYAQEDAFARELEVKLGVNHETIEGYLKNAAEKYRRFGTIFLEKSLHELGTWTSKQTVDSMLRTNLSDIYHSLNRVHQRWFGERDKVIQLFNRYATYNGSDPFRTPGMMTIIPHFEYGYGAFFPKGGMISITRSLVDLAKRLGVHFHMEESVKEILIEQDHVTGIRSAKRELKSDIVISNADVITTYQHLIPTMAVPKRVAEQERSTSALVFYWGIKSSFEELGLHNIFFSQDYKTEFDLLRKGQISDDPTIYLNITSKNQPEDAPEGHENWFILINAPHHTGQDWEETTEQVRQSVLNKLSRNLGKPIQPLISSESILDPESIETKTASYMGSLYGTSSNSIWSAFLRHRNKNKKIKGLYHCGGSVHPGGGIPLCLLSAQIVDELIGKYES